MLALQNQLYYAEQEAAQVVARCIAENPPKPLLAVISPQAVVGATSGGKRWQFGEEGGGAPCPSEFLLRREKRAGDLNGPSRVHPTAVPPTSTNQSSEEYPEEYSDGDSDVLGSRLA